MKQVAKDDMKMSGDDFDRIMRKALQVKAPSKKAKRPVREKAAKGNRRTAKG